MASSGKKGKKTKGKTLALNDFLQETTGSVLSVPLRKTNINWADDVEEPLEYESRPKVNVVLPTAPKASRGVDDFNERVPRDPPYIAYLTNLPYDVDEEEIESLFSNLKISNTRFPKEDRATEAPRLKGYGYIEFEDRDSLTAALAMPDCTLKNRRIRVEVATSFDNDKQRRGGRNDMNRDRGERADTGGDWRSGPRGSEFSDFSRERDSGFSRDRDGGDRGFTRDRDGGGGGFNRDREGGGFNRDREGGGFTRDRDGGGFTRDREGGGFTRDRDGGGFTRDREGGGFTRDRDGGGFTRDREGGGLNRDRDGGSWRDNSDRPINRGFNKDSYGDRGRFNDRERDGGERKGFGPRRERDDNRESFSRSRDEEKPAEPRTRQKLVLAPRTKPISGPDAEDAQQKSQETDSKPTETSTASVSSNPSASIFGAARPVDTAAREREIEDRIAKGKEQQVSRDSSRERGSGAPDDSAPPPNAWKDRSTAIGGNRRGGSPRRGSSERRKYSPRGGYSPRRRSSPRRFSPRGRSSPGRYGSKRRSPGGYYSPRRGSPVRRSPGRGSPPRRRRDSPSGRYSPKRRSSPPGTYPRRDSPDRRSSSPTRRYSPSRPRTPSPRRSPSISPPRARPSDEEERRSDVGSLSSRGSLSPDRRRNSGDRSPSAAKRNGNTSIAYNKKDNRRKDSPSKSKERIQPRKTTKKSPDRIKRNDKIIDQHKKHDDKKNLKDKAKKEKREPHDMPKLKEPEAPNFTVSNKFAFLADCEDADVSD